MIWRAKHAAGLECDIHHDKVMEFRKASSQADVIWHSPSKLTVGLWTFTRKS